MKKHACILCSLIVITAITALPLAAESEIIKLEANASYYGEEFNGRPTSSGEIFDMNAFTAAHRTLPFGTMLEVTNLANGKKVVVRVNDRGPFVPDREIDISKGAAKELNMIGTGTAKVSIRKIDGIDAAAANAVSPVTAADPTPAQTPVNNTPITAAPAVVPAPSLDTSITGSRWRIQLGSFSNEENANRLVVRLRKDGFNPAFEKTGNLTRVVLAGIPEATLSETRGKLDKAGYGEYLVRREQ
jgi:rare lipoprotein A